METERERQRKVDELNSEKDERGRFECKKWYIIEFKKINGNITVFTEILALRLRTTNLSHDKTITKQLQRNT